MFFNPTYCSMCIWTQHIRCIPKTFLRFPVLSVCIICLLLHNINKAERLHNHRKGTGSQARKGIDKNKSTRGNNTYVIHEKDTYVVGTIKYFGQCPSGNATSIRRPMKLVSKANDTSFIAL